MNLPYVSQFVTQPQAGHSVTQPHTSQSGTPPQAAQSVTQPLISQSGTLPQAAECVTHSQAAQSVTQPLTSQHRTQPQAAQSATLPRAAQSMTQRHSSQYGSQPQTEQSVTLPQAVIQPQKLVQEAAIHVEGQEPLTSSMLADASAEEQKQMIGKRLFPIIHLMQPYTASKITGMLLKFDNNELLNMLEHHELLKSKVEEIDTELKKAKKEIMSRNHQLLPAFSVARLQVAQFVTQPHTSQSGTQPQAVHSVARPKATQCVIQPQAAQSVTQPHTSQSGIQPQTGQSVIQPHTSQSGIQPQTGQSVTQPLKATQEAAVHVENQEPLTTSVLANASVEEQKRMIGERLFSVIHLMQPYMAGKITGMLLEFDNHELLNLLEHRELLKSNVEEAVTVLKEADKEAMSWNQPQAAQSETQPPAVAQEAAVHVGGQKPLAASVLANASAEEQKQMIGERLFPVIHLMQPYWAGRITEMLLEFDNHELLNMLEHQELLKSKVEEAVTVLKESLQVIQVDQEENSTY